MDNATWNKNLNKYIGSFVGGQCLIQIKTDEIYRGQIKEIIFPFGWLKQITVVFHWLARRKQVFNTLEILEERWIGVERIPSTSHFIDFSYRFYSVQPDEDRLKVKGDPNEFCRFYLKDDYTNLVLVENNLYEPYFKKRRLQFITALAVLEKRKRDK